MTTQQSYSLGYALAAILLIPIIAWAKIDPAGMYALITVVVIGFICCIIIRICTGEWP